MDLIDLTHWQTVRRQMQDLDFPATEESTSYGTPSYKVRKKFLLRLKEDGETMVIHSDDRDIWLKDDPTVFFFTLTLTLLLGCQTNDQHTKLSPKPADTLPPSWTVKKVDSSRLLFINAPTIDTHLFDLAYIGQVPMYKKAPLLILSGRDCTGCDENLSLYILSPSEGPLEVAEGKNRNQYPGIEKDYETGKWVYSARVFYGQVLKDTNGVIWYESRLLENGQRAQDVFLSWIDHGVKKDTLYNNYGDLSQTLELCGKGLCKEIPGRQYNTEP